ncbi:MAG: DUF1616 domain-containing protein [Staphylothermus sp.]|nr:DUF1616 domain-containing protein [Staphylothermus sp.]
MNLLDEEVFAVILAIIVVGSVFSIAMIFRPENPEPFTAIGLLNENCKIGDYPSTVFNGDNVTLCIFIDNHLDHAALFEVRYKVSDPDHIPTNTTPSPNTTLVKWDVFLDKYDNTTFKVSVPVNVSITNASRIALVFELWVLDSSTRSLVYTGRWVHLYVRVLESPLGG